MSPANLLSFFTLAAIWGASFLFMRIAAPHFGALWTAELRVAFAWLTLVVLFVLTARPLFVRSHLKHFWVVGAFNSGIPFALFSFAALHIPAGYSAILNAIVPLWAAVFSALLLGERLTWRVALGALIAMAGISLMVKLGPVSFSGNTLLAVLACVLATACYGFAGTWTKKHLPGVPGHVSATNSQLFAALTLLPLALLDVPQQMPPVAAWGAVLALAVFCSALAYVLYFRLLTKMSATKATTVTFVIPAFGILWGWVFLSEPITLTMLLGFALVLVATAMVMGLGPFAVRESTQTGSAMRGKQA
jgi:drug/metabolite transporter (DMT)-like permease